MKKYVRVLGIDDSYFVPHVPGKVALIGVVLRTPNYFEGMLKRDIEVDGLDVTDAIIDMINSKYRTQIKVIFMQGITFGGFNIVDMRRIWEEQGIPAIAISRKNPDMKSIENALKKHFPDWKYRMKLIKNFPIEKIKNENFTLYIQHVGISSMDAEKLIKAFTVRGALPEPLRVAHLIASALHFGESRGKP